MSLELAIQENTIALRALIAVMTSAPAAALNEAAPAQAAEPVNQTTNVEPITKNQVKKEAPADQGAEAPTYQATADAVTKLARTKGREVTVDVLAQFGASKLPEVQPEQFAALIAACEAAGA